MSASSPGRCACSEASSSRSFARIWARVRRAYSAASTPCSASACLAVAALEQRLAVLLEETHVDHGGLGVVERLFEFRQGLVHLYLERNRIDLGNRVSGLHDHVVVGVQRDDRAADLGRDRRDVSNHIGVVRVTPGGVSAPTSTPRPRWPRGRPSLRPRPRQRQRPCPTRRSTRAKAGLTGGAASGVRSDGGVGLAPPGSGPIRDRSPWDISLNLVGSVNLGKMCRLS